MSNKKLRSSLALIAAFALAAVVTPITAAPAQAATTPVVVNFETTGAYTNQDFGGNSSSVVTDAPGNATKVLKVVRGAETWAGTTIYNLSGATLITQNHLRVTAAINAPTAGVDLRLKLENSTDSTTTVEADATETSLVGWHTYTFDFAKVANGTALFNSAATYDKASVFFDFGNSVSGATYYLDDLTFPGAVTSVEIPLNFETLGTYTNLDFGGNSSSVVTDAPGNTTKVLKVVRGAETWAGTTIFKSSGTKLISTDNLVVTAEINSPADGAAIRLKLENASDATTNVETNASETSVSGWHTYTFDLSKPAGSAFNSAATYDTASLFFDFGSTNSGATYYVDNILFPGTPLVVIPKSATSTLLTFETGDAAGIDVANQATPQHPLGVFGNNSNTNLAEIASAPAGGNGGMALKMTKKGENWSGLNVLNDTTGTVRYTNADHPAVTFNYYAPHAGPVVVELNPSKVQVSVPAIAGWQTITADFSVSANIILGTWSASTEYNKVSIFPDFLVTSASDEFYFDNIAVNGASTPAIPAPPALTKPVNTVKASLSGTASVGKTLSVNNGTWTGNPAVTLTYKWYRCTVKGSSTLAQAPASSARCSVIRGKTARTYKLTSADKGKYVRASVTAMNSQGSTVTTTKTTGSKVK